MDAGQGRKGRLHGNVRHRFLSQIDDGRAEGPKNNSGRDEGPPGFLREDVSAFYRRHNPSCGFQGATVVFAIRFGVPIFVKPAKEDIKGSLDQPGMEKGILAIPVRNVGNTHFIVQKIVVTGTGQKNETVLSKELAGWYVLTGTSKKYTMPIPKESCYKIARLDIEVKADQFTVKDSLNVQKAMCPH
jgi:hypothetical protein